MTEGDRKCEKMTERYSKLHKVTENDIIGQKMTEQYNTFIIHSLFESPCINLVHTKHYIYNIFSLSILNSLNFNYTKKTQIQNNSKFTNLSVPYLVFTRPLLSVSKTCYYLDISKNCPKTCTLCLST